MTCSNQLTKSTILDGLEPHDQSVVIAIAMPSTPLKTAQLINAFCTFFNCSAQPTDWGADRCQTILSPIDDSLSLCFLMHVDWLCDAIWLEPLGKNQDINALVQYLTTKNV
ncbi:hypothetical protein [Alteromonas sp. A079]|uniref:hypothetical protein n=1 Tax=Alteromonas sp. A079 TaxID=3410268 RepID=UPI003BA33BDC